MALLSPDFAAARLGIERAYASAEEAIADPSVSVIHVCTPNASHFSQAMAALGAGKHVVCEKPLATRASDAEALALAARKSGRIATVPFVYRYHPMVREARALVQDGSVGALQLIHGSYLQDWLLLPTDTSWRLDPDKGGASCAVADIGSKVATVLPDALRPRVIAAPFYVSSGNAEAARQYLAWEVGLLDQLDAQERDVFRIAALPRTSS